MKNKKWKKLFLYLISISLAIIVGFIVIIYLMLFYEVRRVCVKAEAEFKSSCIESLIKVLDSNEKSVKEKNDAIWVLGQLADKRGLSALEKLYTGQIPEREPLDKVISQYELKKAIHWTEGGNWTSWMYFNYR